MSIKSSLKPAAGLESRNPSFRSYIEQKLRGQMLMKHLGLGLTKIEPGLVEAYASIESFMHQQDGFLHGGLTATMSDIVSGFAAYSLVPDGDRVVTADIRISYLKPGIGQSVWARGVVIKPGASFHFCEAEVWTITDKEEPVLIAKSSSTMSVIKQAV